jgi:Flp pilus assembly pilin Flp
LRAGSRLGARPIRSNHTAAHMTHRRHLNLHDSHGQTAAEYAVLLALVFAVVIGVIPLFGTSVAALFNAFAVAFGG